MNKSMGREKLERAVASAVQEGIEVEVYFREDASGNEFFNLKISFSLNDGRINNYLESEQVRDISAMSEEQLLRGIKKLRKNIEAFYLKQNANRLGVLAQT